MIRTTPANRPRHGYNTFVSFTHREKAAAVLVSSSRYTNNPEGALSQDLTELFAQFIDSIRFCGNPSETVFLILGHNRIVRVATGHDRLDIRIDLPELQYRLFPPMPPGMVKSIMTASKGLSAWRAWVYSSMASTPFLANSTVHPRYSSISPSTKRTISSSSMTRTLPLPDLFSAFSSLAGSGSCVAVAGRWMIKVAPDSDLDSTAICPP